MSRFYISALHLFGLICWFNISSFDEFINKHLEKKCVTMWLESIATVMAKNIGTLGKYDQKRLWKLICIVNPFDLL